MGQSHPRFKNLLLIAIITFLCITPIVTATTTNQWTSSFNSADPSQNGQDVVIYNSSVQMKSSVSPNTTAWELWILSGLVGLILFIMSLKARTNSAEVIIDAIISVLAWVPIGFCSYASLSIDRIIGYGITSQIFNTTTVGQAQFYNHEYVYLENHLIYNEPIVAILMFVFLSVAIGNTLRIISLHNALKGKES